ncbi:MAG TPA: PEGA domain-containing protein, partial [Methanosarcinales archaeon]|nr:PEGA domain-containing protein [Methanosarcinales archaeon]
MSDTYTGFSTTPIKANLFVNGNIVATTPYSATWFKAGDAIRIELAGYKTISFILTADRIGKSNYYLLETDAAAPVTAKTYGDVQIRSSPTNARIFIGGSDTGKNTPFLITLETGLRTITLKKAGYQDLTWTEVITSMSKILPLRFLVQVPIPVPTPAPVPEPTPTPTASPFRQKWDEIVADVKAGNWLRVLTGVLVLPTLRTIPGDEKVLAGTVPISPAAGLEAYLIASATANTAKAVTKGTTYFTGFEKIRRAFSSSAGLSKLWWAIAGIVGLDGIMTWLASDNIITGSSFTLNKLSAAAIDETITKEDAIAQLDKVQKWKDYATNFVRTSTIVNPLLWLFRGILLTNAEKGQDDINLERGKIEAIIRVKEIPEVVKAVVSDILDGDTIVVRRKGEGEALPEYLKTGHARIRINGINAPEKSPKGEITCTGIDLYKVEPKWADESRNALLPLNEKEVTLNIDPENSIDSYGRVIAKVISAGVDVGLSQIKNGLACYYFVEKNKYVD